MEKGQSKKWKIQEILKVVKDLVGFRIVCANLEDIRRITTLIVNNPRIEEVYGSEEDRTITPTPLGYRDYKFYIRYKTGDPTLENIICEIQIRTMLQDGWAFLAHKDLYKNDDLPEPLKKLSIRLSALLAVADQIAQDIRDQVSQKRNPIKGGGKLLTEDSLRVLYKKVFKELAPDYLVQSVKNKSEELGIIHIESLKEALSSERKIKKMKNIYKEIVRWDMSNELLFDFAPLLAVYGPKIAFEAVKKRAQIEWEEVERTYRGEIESEFPETIEQFIENLEPHYKDDLSDFPDKIYRLAEYFNALDACLICSAPIVDEEGFQIGVEKFYKCEDLEGRIQTTIINSGVDIGERGLCSYHAHVMSKED